MNFQSDQKHAVVQRVSQHSFQLQKTYCLEWRRAGASRAHMQLRNCVFPDLCNGECAGASITIYGEAVAKREWRRGGTGLLQSSASQTQSCADVLPMRKCWATKSLNPSFLQRRNERWPESLALMLCARQSGSGCWLQCAVQTTGQRAAAAAATAAAAAAAGRHRLRLRTLMSEARVGHKLCRFELK